MILASSQGMAKLNIFLLTEMVSKSLKEDYCKY